ncbi:MAG: glycosyltransferase [Planctomycetota bacterium]|nr:MAG: glycosyltransferase [Planctomycetota bacterium]
MTTSQRPTRILFCWSRLSGYMAACWRHLAQRPDVDLRVLAWSTASPSDHADFAETVASGVDCRLLSAQDRTNFERIEQEACEFAPDVLVISGWMSPAYTKLVQRLRPRVRQVVMGMDTPWQGRAKQFLTRVRYASLLRQVDDVVVAGERSWQYARRLGFADSSIHRGVYAWDEVAFAPVAEQRNAVWESPPRFLYVGRYAEEKGLKTLLDAYRVYREQRDDPWSLWCCGAGPLESCVNGQPGVTNLGFVQPDRLPEVLRDATAFVLPSNYEPWGVALAEAMGAGLPGIATTACGAAIDLIRDDWNGQLVATGCTSALAEALMWMHDQSDRLAEMGRNAALSAQPFTAANWCRRWSRLLELGDDAARDQDLHDRMPKQTDVAAA